MVLGSHHRAGWSALVPIGDLGRRPGGPEVRGFFGVFRRRLVGELVEPAAGRAPGRGGGVLARGLREGGVPAREDGRGGVSRGGRSRWDWGHGAGAREDRAGGG